MREREGKRIGEKQILMEKWERKKRKHIQSSVQWIYERPLNFRNAEISENVRFPMIVRTLLPNNYFRRFEDLRYFPKDCPKFIRTFPMMP